MNCFGEIRETKFIFVFARERGNTCVTNATGFAPLFLCFRLPRNYSHAGEKKDYLKVAAGRSPREREHLHNNMVKSPSKNGVKKLFALAATDTIAPCTTVHDDADEIIVAVYPTFNQEGTANSSVKRSASSSSSAASAGTGDDGIKSCVVSDGRDYLQAFAMGASFRTKNKGHQSLGSKPCLIRVKSYISSLANVKDLLLVLISGDIVQRHYQNKDNKPPSPTSSFFRPFSLQHACVNKDQDKSIERTNHRTAKNGKKDAPTLRIPGGGAPQFFNEWAPAISNQALAGITCKLVVSNKVSSRMTSAQQHATILCNFLTHHNAMSTLHRHRVSSQQPMDQSPSSISSTNDSFSQKPSTRTGGVDVQYYMSALKEFRESQLDRQKASLTSNSGREDAKRSKMVETQYLKALAAALGNGAEGTQQQAAPHLSRNTICFWHSILCGDGVHDDAGRLRSKAVRVGHVYFRPHTKVAADVDTLCHAIRSLEGRLLKHSHLSQHSQSEGNNPGWEAATFAAAVFFGLVDTHGFVDGNGRLARIAVNWALQKAGLPFVIHLFATPGQRKEYTEAIVQTRRNLSLVSTSLSSSEMMSSDILAHTLEYAGALFPLVDLILDRVAKAISEFEKVILDKSRLVSEETEAKAAKAVRDRERAGTCLICFEENPNIATLCCGKAVHLNCVAQWISNCSVDQATCPNCRESFPSLPPRLQAPIRSENSALEHYEEVEESSTVSMDDSVELSDDSSTSSTSSDMMHALAEAARTARLVNGDQHDSDDEEEDSDDSVPADNAAGDLARFLVYQMAAQNESDETSEDSTSETVEVDHSAARSHVEENFDTSSTTEEDSDDTTEEMQEAPDEESVSSMDETTTQTNDSDRSALNNGLPPFCWNSNCRNRSARDCANESCGRCCVLHGEYECERHRGDI